MKYKKINKKDILSGIKLKVKAKKSEPACMLCLPPAPLRDHKYLHGIMVHSRIDCPPNNIYFFSEEEFMKE